VIHTAVPHPKNKNNKKTKMTLKGEVEVLCEWGFTKRMTYLILSFLIFVVTPLYVYREAMLLRAAAVGPISRVVLFGESLDPQELAARLNPSGKPIYMTEVVAHTYDSCSAEVPSFPRGRMTTVTFNVGVEERHGVVYVPNSYPANDSSRSNTAVTGGVQPVPMLVLFHGLNDNCDNFLKATGFVPYAEKHGFLIVSACGSQGYLGTAWNSGTCCGFSNDKPDDVGFAKEIVTSMRKAMCVDERKVMAVGFSNGAMMAEVLACEAPEVYQAVASIGGVVELRPGNDEGLAECTKKTQQKKHRASVLMVHGTADVMVPWGGSQLLGFPPITKNLAEWVARNDCNVSNSHSTIKTKTYTNTIYDTCNSTQMRAARAPVYEPILGFSEFVQPQRNSEALLKVFANLSKKSTQTDDNLAQDAEVNNEHGYDKEDGANNDKYSDRHQPERGPHHPRHGPHGPRGVPYFTPTTTYPNSNVDFPYIAVCQAKLDTELQATVYADSDASEIELVRVEGGGHRWPEDDEFSTTDYIVQFGARVFGGYTF
jgi:poly(3-hydroxybutyrate) depolymerase